MKYLSTFPGQGSQYVGMLEHVTQDYLDLVSQIVPYELDKASNGLQTSVDIQLSILLNQMYTNECLTNKGLTHDLVGGHSIGAFSAAVAAGVISKEDAIKLVYHRALEMEKLYSREMGYGIGVVIGLTHHVLQSYLDDFLSTLSQQKVYLSNINSETQITVSGKLSDIKVFFEYVTTQDAVTTKFLNVPVPSHCELMNPVATELNVISESIMFHQPLCPYLSNVTGLPLTKAEDVKQDLLTNVAFPVLWDTMSDIALELGIDGMIEYEPGTTLTKLMKQKSPDTRVIPIEQMKLDGTLYLLNKWRD